jgi:hypothetical protein
MTLHIHCPMALVAAMTFLGCESLEDNARNDFAKEYSCPPTRVEIRTRNDPDQETLLSGKAPDPPKEIAHDPGRLAIWKKEQAERRSYNYGTIYEVRGCGHGKLYACSRSTGKSHGSTSSLCLGHDYPAGAKRW